MSMRAVVAESARRRPGQGRRRVPGRALQRRRLNDSAMRKLLGARVRALRIEAGLTQLDLAGPRLSRAGVAKIERGASWPSVQSLEQLARVLRTAPREVIPSDL